MEKRREDVEELIIQGLLLPQAVGEETIQDVTFAFEGVVRQNYVVAGFKSVDAGFNFFS